MSFATALGVVDGRGPGDTWHRLLAVFLGLAVVAGLTALTAALVIVRSERVRPRELPHLLIAFWSERASGWKMFLLGSLLTLPAFALFMPTLGGDSDSARLVASILYVQENGVDYLLETQEVLLPHLVLGPIMAVGSLPGVQAVDVLSVLLLGGAVSFLAWRLTRSVLAAVAAALALASLPEILERAYLVPMYPTMLALGLLGVYLAQRAIVAETRSARWRTAVLAGLCLVLSFEAHQVGQLFLVVTALLVVTGRPSATLPGLGRVYLAVAVLAVPRVVVNLTEGGFDQFAKNRVDFWITEGYLQPIQAEFFNLPIRAGLADYLEGAPRGLFNAWDPPGLLVLALGLVGILVMSSRLRRFTLACVCLMVAVALYRRLPFYPRYFSLLLVGSALAAGIAFSAHPRLSSKAGRAVVGLALAGLVVSAAVSYRETIEKTQVLERALASSPYARFANAIPPGGGVVGTRSQYLNSVATDIRAYGGQFLTEREYVTFLTWPSDRAAVRVMRRHDAEWVFVPARPWKWVYKYNDVWLIPNHGKSARYHQEVRESPLFCRVIWAKGGEALYKLDPAGADEPAPARGPRRCEPSIAPARR
ncbi:MAG: hypothetical protein ACRDNI_00490 [Gaiellaceae bacterium]